MPPPHTQLAVIGGGPAGLRAAEVAAMAGLQVTVFDAKPSVGRKFLVAGKGGLNLTHEEAAERFSSRYTGPDQPAGIWRELLADCDAAAVRAWAEGLGVETFRATSGRVYPKSLKAAPLLRRWLDRLRGLGVRFAMNHRWTGMTPGELRSPQSTASEGSGQNARATVARALPSAISASLRFCPPPSTGTPHHLAFANGSLIEADAVIFALGGASWPQTGSDGGWLPRFEELGIACHDLVAANCGWRHPWPPEVLASAEGQPLKNLTVSAGFLTVSGELLVTNYGLEGGAIYQLGPALRAMRQPAIAIDFKPTFSEAQLIARMESVRRDFLTAAGNRWKLSEAAQAIVGRHSWHDAGSLAREVKRCVIALDGPQPVAEAISCAGGVGWSGLNASLMVRDLPGVFVAGEMIDWEAPTGGYLIQGCFATGTRAARAAAAWLRVGKPLSCRSNPPPGAAAHRTSCP